MCVLNGELQHLMREVKESNQSIKYQKYTLKCDFQRLKLMGVVLSRDRTLRVLSCKF